MAVEYHQTPAMTEPEYHARFASASREDLLRLCRAAGFTAHRLKTNEELLHLLWVKIGRPRAEAYTALVNAALEKLGCERKDS